MPVRGISHAVAIAVLAIVAVMFGIAVYLMGKTYIETSGATVMVSVNEEMSHVAGKTIVSASVRVSALTDNPVTIEKICLFGITTKGNLVPLSQDCAPAYPNPCWASATYGKAPPFEVQPGTPVDVAVVITYNPSCSPVTEGTDLVKTGVVIFYSTPEGYKGVAVSELG